MMSPDDLMDVRTQDRLRRDLEIRLGQAVMHAIGSGLMPENAMKAVQSLWESEKRCEETRKAFVPEVREFANSKAISLREQDELDRMTIDEIADAVSRS